MSYVALDITALNHLFQFEYWESKTKMKFKLMVVSLLNWFRFVSQQQTGPTQCVIVQDKMSIFTPQTPSFLSNNNKTECQVHGAEDGFLRCGTSNMYIKPECVCTFHNVYEAMYHRYSSCPHGEESDVVTQLKCSDCKRNSLSNNGPCINGGNLTCKGDEVAPNIYCRCPPNYKGLFCEEKMENLTRISDEISFSQSSGLRNCHSTKKNCVTYSRNRQYAYKCYETDYSQERRGLPLCIDTEDIQEIRTVSNVSHITRKGLIDGINKFSHNYGN